MNKEKFGFQNLAKKGLAVITAALSTFSQTKAAVPHTNYESDDNKNISLYPLFLNGTCI